MRAKPKTFRDTLAQVAEANANHLMHRARLANRLAKASVGTARRNAYKIKALALQNICRNFPERAEIVADPKLPEFVLVRVRAARFALHTPIANF